MGLQTSQVAEAANVIIISDQTEMQLVLSFYCLLSSFFSKMKECFRWAAGISVLLNTCMSEAAGSGALFLLTQSKFWGWKAGLAF